MSILRLTSRIVKESNLKVPTIAKKCGICPNTIRFWEKAKKDNALVCNVNAVLNQCGYELAIVRKLEGYNAETREQQTIS